MTPPRPARLPEPHVLDARAREARLLHGLRLLPGRTQARAPPDQGRGTGHPR